MTYPSEKLHSRADLLRPGDEATRAKQEELSRTRDEKKRAQSSVTYPSAQIFNLGQICCSPVTSPRGPRAVRPCQGQERTQERSGPGTDYRTSVFRHEEEAHPIRVEIEIKKSAIDDLQKEGMMDKIFYYRLCGYLECTKTA